MVEGDIDKFESCMIESGSCRIIIDFSLIGVKILSIILNTSSMQICPIFDEAHKNFNNLSNRESGIFVSNSESLCYGISSLYAQIRFFGCCLHVSYRLIIKKSD